MKVSQKSYHAVYHNLCASAVALISKLEGGCHNQKQLLASIADPNRESSEYFLPAPATICFHVNQSIRLCIKQHVSVH